MILKVTSSETSNDILRLACPEPEHPSVPNKHHAIHHSHSMIHHDKHHSSSHSASYWLNFGGQEQYDVGRRYPWWIYTNTRVELVQEKWYRHAAAEKLNLSIVRCDWGRLEQQQGQTAKNPINNRWVLSPDIWPRGSFLWNNEKTPKSPIVFMWGRLKHHLFLG